MVFSHERAMAEHPMDGRAEHIRINMKTPFRTRKILIAPIFTFTWPKSTATTSKRTHEQTHGKTIEYNLGEQHPPILFALCARLPRRLFYAQRLMFVGCAIASRVCSPVESRFAIYTSCAHRDPNYTPNTTRRARGGVVPPVVLVCTNAYLSYMIRGESKCAIYRREIGRRARRRRCASCSVLSARGYCLNNAHQARYDHHHVHISG